MFRVELQATADQVFGFVGNGEPVFFSERKVSFHDFRINLLVCFPIERWITAKHDIKDHSSRPDIAFLVIVFRKHFRSNIVNCSVFLVHVLVLVEVLAGSKIDDFDLVHVVLALQKDVFGFQISVDDFVIVAISHCRNQLLEHQCSRLLREVVLVDDEIEEFSSLAQFSHDVEILFVLVEFQDLEHAGMVNFSQQIDLVDQLFLLALGLAFFVDDLDGHFLTSHKMDTFAAFTKGAFSDRWVVEFVVFCDF